MAQKIYDTPDFFSGYSQLPRQVQGLNGAPQWPALRAMLPNLAGKRVADLGCGLRLGYPGYYGRLGFAVDPNLSFNGVPPEYFMALAVGDGSMPAGAVFYQPDFYES